MIIQLKARPGDWSAYVKGEPEIHEDGDDPKEAIDKLIHRLEASGQPFHIDAVEVIGLMDCA